MSLINEALRKARQEAEQQREEERTGRRQNPGGSYRRPKAHLPDKPSRTGIAVVAGLFAGFVLALGIGWFFVRGTAPSAPQADEPTQVAGIEAPSEAPTATPEAPPAAPEAAEPEPTAQTPADPNSSAGRQTAVPQPRAEILAPVETVPSPRPMASADPGEPSATAPIEIADRLDEPQPAEKATTEPVIAPEPPRAPETIDEVADNRTTEGQNDEESLPKLIEPPESVGRVGETNEFVLEADLGDTTLTLDFIVWNPNAPFAQINGKQVEVGQLVAGLLVESIERDRVTLKATDGRLVLRVR